MSKVQLTPIWYCTSSLQPAAPNKDLFLLENDFYSEVFLEQ